MMKPTEKRTNDGIEGFGNYDALGKDAKRTVCFTPMSGLLSQEKYLPIRYAPLQLNSKSFQAVLKWRTHSANQTQPTNPRVSN